MELALLLALGSALVWVLERLEIPFGAFSRVLGFSVILGWYFTWRIFPPLLFSLLAIYCTGIGIGLLGYASSSEKHWQEFCRPVIAALDGINIPARIARAFVVIILPLIVATLTYQSWIPVYY